MTAPALDELLSQTDAIRAKYPHYWRDEQAQAELKAIWGDAVNAQGVFVDSPDEVLYDKDGCRASISIGTARGVFAYGCSYRTPTEGYGHAPSISGEFSGRTAKHEQRPLIGYSGNSRLHSTAMRRGSGRSLTGCGRRWPTCSGSRACFDRVS